MTIIDLHVIRFCHKSCGLLPMQKEKYNVHCRCLNFLTKPKNTKENCNTIKEYTTTCTRKAFKTELCKLHEGLTSIRVVSKIQNIMPCKWKPTGAFRMKYQINFHICCLLRTTYSYYHKADTICKSLSNPEDSKCHVYYALLTLEIMQISISCMLNKTWNL